MKWFQIDQNNSGGDFVVDKTACHRMFFEAEDEAQAELKLNELGVELCNYYEYYCGCCHVAVIDGVH